MEKMRMESVDMTAQNIDRIAALFPNCVTEAKGEDGKLKKVVNFDSSDAFRRGVGWRRVI